MGKAVFGLSWKNQAHIMGILRDGLYSDRELAVLREYAANAWDSHRTAGKSDIPIKIRVPTAEDPSLVIRDYGAGLTEAEVFEVYTQYGESTKRDTDDAVGMLGIGSKSGFAYSDTFTVTSWCDGFKRIYIAVLDESEVGEIRKLHEEPCGDETGLEIQVPVKTTDIENFRSKAVKLFQYMLPRPDINVDLPIKVWNIQKSGFIEKGSYEWVAIMGCIPYRLNLDQIRTELQAENLLDCLSRVHGGLFFNIGEVRISANREELKYTDSTKEAIVKRLRQLIDEYIDSTLQSLKVEAPTSPWEKRLQAYFMTNTLRLPVPKAYAEWSKEVVGLLGEGAAVKEAPTTFKFLARGNYSGMSQATKISVRTDAQFLIRDSSKKIDGFRFNGNTVIISPPDEVMPLSEDGTPTEESWEDREEKTKFKAKKMAEVRAELDQRLEALGLTGIPIGMLSSIPWQAPHGRTPYKRQVDPKHRVATFQINTTKNTWLSAHSSSWEIVQREPQDTDVFVILEAFKVKGNSVWYDEYMHDKKLAKILGRDMPPVYGYKSTVDKPVTPADRKGMDYSEWRKKFFRQELPFKWLQLIRDFEWSRLFEDEGYKSRDFLAKINEHLPKLKAELGDKHLITRSLEAYVRGTMAMSKQKYDVMEVLPTLAKLYRAYQPASERTWAKVIEAYPLLKIGGIASFGSETAAHWIEYVHLKDLDRAIAGTRIESPAGLDPLPAE